MLNDPNLPARDRERFRAGIDPRTAKVQTRDFGALGNVTVNRFAASRFSFVDGVFIPDGASGKAQIPISARGDTIEGLPATSGKAWDMIRNGPVSSQHSPSLDGIDFTGAGRSLLGLHANAGITFDLEAIRAAAGYQGQPLRFRSQLGYFGAEGAFHADAWIFVDGSKRAEYRGLKRAQGLQQVDLELPAEAKLLTLVATDGGNGYSHDQIGFGDPRLHPDSSKEHSPQQREQLAKLRARQRRIADSLEQLGAPPRFYGVTPVEAAVDVRVFSRGNPESPVGEPLPPAGLSCLKMLEPGLGDLDSSSDARRASLAHWITDPANPLMPRIIVNRLWQWHFGRGIVNTPSDFGYGGGRPSHPELLDWLAQQLRANDYSLKAAHRLIVTSRAYRQRSQTPPNAHGAEVDADNRWLWRQNPRRLEAEAIRDAVLAVSGKLNPQRGGPGFEDFQYQDAYAPIYKYTTADEPRLWRRAIYRFRVRTTPNQFLTSLDCPNPANLTPQRIVTTTPLQSLALYNNDFMLKQAQYFAERLQSERGDQPKAQADRAFSLAFGRPPQSRERALALQVIQQHGLFTLCRALLNANEFIYVD